MTRQDTIAERERAIGLLKQYRGRTFYTSTDYGRGATAYVRIYVAEGRDEITDISYLVARARERRMTDRGIAYGGGGYSKGLEAAMDAASVTGDGRDFDQSRWQRLS